uniref:Phospholipid-transporting ATPase n=1 Tax=Octactis speculum TaxID=3111310 RepID=A0A7S2CW43_9STRA
MTCEVNGKCGDDLFGTASDMFGVMSAENDMVKAARAVGELLSTCHNVVVDEDEKTHERTYEAESPDEEALVCGGKKLGYTYAGTSTDTIFVDRSDKRVNYKLLALIPFSSLRKRMSVLIETESGDIILYCKGADNIMFDRASDYKLAGSKETLNQHLEICSSQGLRTLVLAMKIVSRSTANNWIAKWKKALTSQHREEEMANAAAEMEIDLSIIGCSAIEDRLQDGVPDTIADLKNAGIKIWVLTGDKMTTAINIGQSCKLLNTSMVNIKLEYCDEDGDSMVIEELETKCKKYADSDNIEDKQLALIVDGPSLTVIMAKEDTKEKLLKLACCCRAVIACRVSPAQKQLIVKMVKTGLSPSPITLSIGDGANDVPMIQEAQIGVGISGKEGLQAVNSSDFAIAQFRFLKPLLLVHGRWNYRRISSVIIYSFYKNTVLVCVLFLYTCYSGFSGQSLYGGDSWCYSGYNFFLGLPPFFLGFFDKDVQRETSLQYHKLYEVGLLKQDLNITMLAKAFLQSIFDALVIFYIPYAAYSTFWEADGTLSGLDIFGNAVFLIMVLCMMVKNMMLFNTWNKYVVAGFVFCVFLYIFFVVVYTNMTGFTGVYAFQGIVGHMIELNIFWIVAILVMGFVNLTDLARYIINMEFFPDRVRIAQILELEQRRGQVRPSSVVSSSDSTEV